MSGIRLMVVDDQALLVSAFVSLIDRQPDMQTVGTANDGEEAIAVAAATHPDVVLMDIRMPRLDGVAATAAIMVAQPGTRVLILTTFNTNELVVGALAAGARGFLLKDAEPDHVLDAIRTLHRGEAVLDQAVAGHVVAAFNQALVSPTGQAILTPREIEVLGLIAEGRNNQEIATMLFVAESTIKTHVSNLLIKLNARDRVALVIVAYAMGLARPRPLPA